MREPKNLPEVLKAVGKNLLNDHEVSKIVKNVIFEGKKNPETMLHFEIQFLGYGHESFCSVDFKTPEEVKAYKDGGGKWKYYPVLEWLSGK